MTQPTEINPSVLAQSVLGLADADGSQRGVLDVDLDRCAGGIHRDDIALR
jgi:hypothetical protein